MLKDMVSTLSKTLFGLNVIQTKNDWARIWYDTDKSLIDCLIKFDDTGLSICLVAKNNDTSSYFCDIVTNDINLTWYEYSKLVLETIFHSQCALSILRTKLLQDIKLLEFYDGLNVSVVESNVMLNSTETIGYVLPICDCKTRVLFKGWDDYQFDLLGGIEYSKFVSITVSTFEQMRENFSKYKHSFIPLYRYFSGEDWWFLFYHDVESEELVRINSCVAQSIGFNEFSEDVQKIEKSLNLDGVVDVSEYWNIYSKVLLKERSTVVFEDLSRFDNKFIRVLKLMWFKIRRIFLITKKSR